jgi:4-carboxymuconolactone decarboxylase
VTTTLQSPRIAPLSKGERTEDDERAIAKSAGADGSEYNIFTTAARHRALFPALLQLTTRILFRGDLSAREREILVLRTAARCSCAYEQKQHEALGEKVGVEPAVIAALRDTSGVASDFSDSDRQLVDAADELIATKMLSDETWAGLAARYSETQLIELIVIVGHYQTLAMFLNAVDVVPDEPGLTK